MNAYTITIRNLYTSKRRTVQVEDVDPMVAHKYIYMRELKSDEEIYNIINSKETVVFDSKNGFLQATKV